MVLSVEVDLSDYVVKLNAYECTWCHALNDSMTAAWCSCLSARTTLACARCGRCFCGASSEWKDAFIKSVAGTVFLQREQKRKTAKLAAVPEPHALRRPLILIVDDDKVIHLIADRVLRDLGGTILHAEDGAAGLAMALETRPDLVITDALLPKLDGRELSRILKSDPTNQFCKLVVMTTLYKGRRYRDEAFKKFLVDEYLEKPVSASALHALASRLLGVHHEIAS